MPNRLAGATSPYLLQHADNPVDWWEWGDDAFAVARERGVPVLLSVGYSACHWCHVTGTRLGVDRRRWFTLRKRSDRAAAGRLISGGSGNLCPKALSWDTGP